VAIPAIVAHELFYGAFKSRRAAQNLALIDAIQFVVLEFDEEDARQAGAIRALLASKGTPIGPYDVLIAGQGVVWNLILVTHITQEFGRVPGLRFEDWPNMMRGYGPDELGQLLERPGGTIASSRA
jgi:tRNA(fMet)-specific endonuclease VapC